MLTIIYVDMKLKLRQEHWKIKVSFFVKDHTELTFGGNMIRETLQLCQKCPRFGDFHCFFWVVTGADRSHKPEILEPSSIRILTRGYR